MSNLNAVLDQLRETLQAKQQANAAPATQQKIADDGIDKQQARAAIHQFISAAILSKPTNTQPPKELDPQLGAQSAQALAEFLGVPLRNGNKQASQPVQKPAQVIAAAPATPAPSVPTAPRANHAGTSASSARASNAGATA